MEFIKLIDAQPIWHEGYANTPGLHLTVCDKDLNSYLENITHTIVAKEDDRYYLTARQGGFVSYGMYTNTEIQLFQTRPSGGIEIFFIKDGKRVSVNFKGYSSSRAEVFNALSASTDPDNADYLNNFFEASYSPASESPRIGCRFSGAISIDYAQKVVAPLLKTKDTYLLLCLKRKPSVKSFADDQLSMLPSLSPDKFVLPEGCEWKEQKLDTEFVIKSHL